MNFTADGRESKIVGDIQRTWQFQVTFPNIGNIIDKALAPDLVEELTVRARSVSIPQRGLDVIKTEWFGLSQNWPSKPSMNQTVTIQFLESENMNMIKIMNDWQQKIFSYKSGHSRLAGKRPANQIGSYVQDLQISLLNYKGEAASDKIILCKNAFPTSVEDIALAYSDSSAMMINVTFTFDIMHICTVGENLIDLI